MYLKHSSYVNQHSLNAFLLLKNFRKAEIDFPLMGSISVFLYVEFIILLWQSDNEIAGTTTE